MKIIFLTTFLIISHGIATGQFNGGVPWSIQVDKKFADQEVVTFVEYKNADGEVIHTDEFLGEINQNGFVGFIIGSPYKDPLPPSLYKDVRKFCWKATFIDQDGDPMVSGMQDVMAVPVSNVSGIALDAERLQGSVLIPTGMSIRDFLMLPEQIREILVHTSGDGFPSSLRKVNISDVLKCDKAMSPLTGQLIDVLRVGGGENGKPIVFNSGLPEEIADYFAVYAVLTAFRHAWAVRVKKNEEHRPEGVNHNTAAIYADNTENEMSAGVLSNAQTWGVFGTGANGTVGISTGTGNGAGAWGQVAQAPAAGGFKYALYGQSQSLSGAWAAALFGNGFHTGTWMMSSDARLKTEIRSQTSMLDRVMQLRPSEYRFRQDTPYGLPAGIHHGFLAQELEEIFPELVSDITMPLSADPNEMHKSGTTEYKGVNYIEMIAILTGALQELNTTLNSKIEAQAKEIEALKAQLNKNKNEN